MWTRLFLIVLPSLLYICIIPRLMPRESHSAEPAVTFSRMGVVLNANAANAAHKVHDRTQECDLHGRHDPAPHFLDVYGRHYSILGSTRFGSNKEAPKRFGDACARRMRQ